MKNPKVMGLMAAGIMTAAVITGCSKKEDVRVYDPTIEAFDRVKNSGSDLDVFDSSEKEKITERLIWCVGKPDTKKIDFKKLEQIKDDVDMAVKKDSVNFVNKPNKTKADTLSMIESFKNRERTQETVQYLKNLRAKDIALERARKLEEQRADSMMRAELDSYMNK